MAKTVFRPGEVTLTGNTVVLDPPHSFPGLEHFAPVEDAVEEIEEAVEFQGPTADDLRREAEMFKAQWEQEKEAMIAAARAEADSIIREAEQAAAETARTQSQEAGAIRREAEDEAARVLDEARENAGRIEAGAQEAFDNARREAGEEGRNAGREEGFALGKAEVERLVERTQTILERAQAKREEILTETEQHIVGLVLLISHKVIKVLSENQKTVVIENVKQALRKLKGRDKGVIYIKTNVADLKLTTEHAKEFIALVEGAQSVQIVEDSTVDPGGCIIETDFGEIDARISSQFAELETRIREITPIKAKAKPQAGAT
jgi:flagellar assembly protein FliH